MLLRSLLLIGKRGLIAIVLALLRDATFRLLIGYCMLDS